MKLIKPNLIIAVVSLLLCTSCVNSSLFSSDLERAKIYQNKGGYEKAIQLASTSEAYREDSKEAQKIVSESTRAQMLIDLDLIWDGKLSDEEAKRKGYYITRYRSLDSAREEKKKSEQNSAHQSTTAPWVEILMIIMNLNLKSKLALR